MKRIIVVTLVLIMAVGSYAMSGGSDSNPKNDINSIDDKIFDCVPDNKDERQVSKEELRNVAINYYKYEFEEEHEWKKMERKSDEKIIFNIVPIKADELTLAYYVYYKPDGHAVICAWKNESPILQTGGGTASSKNENSEIQLKDLLSAPFYAAPYVRQKKLLESGKYSENEKAIKVWEKFSIPPEQFKLKINFDKAIPQPDWWLEKKRIKK